MQFIGRVSAHAYTSKLVLFWTGTVDDAHRAEFDPKASFDLMLQYMGRMKIRPKGFAVTEFGTMHGREHCHAYMMFDHAQPIDVPLDVRLSAEMQKEHIGRTLWPWGFMQFEAPRNRTGSTVYLQKYLDKGGYSIWRSQGLGKEYLQRYARHRGKTGQRLSDGYGISYTVPGNRKVKTDQFGKKVGFGDLWEYHIRRNHAWVPELIEIYVRAFFEEFGKLPPTEYLKGLDHDW